MGSKKNALIYLAVFTGGMAVMAFELGASRLYAPYYGSSLYVWAGLIGALLFFLSVGNYIGGRMSRGGSGAPGLFAVLLAASLFGAAAPYTALPVMRATSLQAGSGAQMLPGILAATVASLAAPLVLLGCILPIATGILTRRAEDAGRIVGVLNALSTIGCIAGIFISTLVTIPYLGTRMTFFIFALAPALTAAAGLATARAAAALILFAPLAASAGRFPLRPPPDDHIRLAEAETPYNYVQVVEHAGFVKMLVNQGWVSYSKYKKGEIRSGSYRDYFPLAKSLSGDADFPRSVCILGLAGGTDARVLRHAFPGARIVGVEIDPRLVELSSEYMGLDIESMVDEIVISDGRSFLRNSPAEFDLIIIDVYTHEFIPFHMATVEFFEIVSDSLTPGGVAAMNVAWRSKDEWTLPRRCANTLAKVFPSIYIQMFHRKINTIIYASKERVPPGQLAANRAGERNGYVRRLVSLENYVFRPYDGEAPFFTDDLAPVEQFTNHTIGMIAAME